MEEAWWEWIMMKGWVFGEGRVFPCAAYERGSMEHLCVPLQESR